MSIGHTAEAPERFGWIGGEGEPVAARAARRSALVGIMKVVLPLVAAALTALLLVWPQLAGRQDGFRLSFRSVEIADNALTMANPRYRGTDRNNRPFNVTGDRAVQDPVNPQMVTLERLAADLTLAGGGWLSLTARQGVYDQEEQTLRLLGDIALHTDSGYEFRGEAATVDLRAGTVTSERDVHGQGPAGLLDAQTMRVSERGDVIRFGGGVRTVIFPGGAK